MATQLDNPQQPDGTPLQPAESIEQSVPQPRPAHGSTGEGSGSAMARLISQEQARMPPAAPEDAPTGSS
jgi:hypothetical protein